jgi:DUF4097 and DUF4098 domain-containing protein YvlB
MGVPFLVHLVRHAGNIPRRIFETLRHFAGIKMEDPLLRIGTERFNLLNMSNKSIWNRPTFWAVGGILFMTSAWTVCAAVIESNIDKTFPAEPGGTLLVDVDRGSIEISTHDAKEVAVHVLRKIEGVAEARAAGLFAEQEVQFKSDDGRIEVKGFATTANRVWNRERSKLQIRYQITVPKKFNLELNTGAGSIDCTPIQGNVKGKSGGGSLKFSGVDGTLEAETGAGGIEVAKVTGTTSLKSGGGGIKLGDSTGVVKIETGAGSIDIKRATGKLQAKSHGGSLTAGVLLETAELKTAAGAIRVDEAKEALQVESGGGSVEVANASSTVQAHTGAGTVKVGFIAQPAGNSRVHSGGGSVDVTLAPGLGFELNARTGGGTVTTDVPVATVIKGKQPNDQIKGKIGEGGPNLDIETGAGTVHIRKGAGR